MFEQAQQIERLEASLRTATEAAPRHDASAEHEDAKRVKAADSAGEEAAVGLEALGVMVGGVEGALGALEKRGPLAAASEVLALPAKGWLLVFTPKVDQLGRGLPPGTSPMPVD